MVCAGSEIAYFAWINEFDDAADPDLSAACNHLSAWVEPLPPGTVVDVKSGLTERDLALILRYLHATRRGDGGEMATMQTASQRKARPSVPITANNRT